MAAQPHTNHRRDRHEVRRVLARLVIQGRDVAGSISFGDFDLLERNPRLSVNDNHQDVVADDRSRA